MNAGWGRYHDAPLKEEVELKFMVIDKEIVSEMGTVKDLSQICRCLGGAIGVIGLHPALLLFEQRYV